MIIWQQHIHQKTGPDHVPDGYDDFDEHEHERDNINGHEQENISNADDEDNDEDSDEENNNEDRNGHKAGHIGKDKQETYSKI